MKFFSLDVNKFLFNKKCVNLDSWICVGCGVEVIMWLLICLLVGFVLFIGMF